MTENCPYNLRYHSYRGPFRKKLTSGDGNPQEYDKMLNNLARFAVAAIVIATLWPIGLGDD